MKPKWTVERINNSTVICIPVMIIMKWKNFFLISFGFLNIKDICKINIIIDKFK